MCLCLCVTPCVYMHVCMCVRARARAILASQVSAHGGIDPGWRGWGALVNDRLTQRRITLIGPPDVAVGLSSGTVWQSPVV